MQPSSTNVWLQGLSYEEITDRELVDMSILVVGS